MRSPHSVVVACTAALLTLAVSGGPARPAIAWAQTNAALQGDDGTGRLTVDQVSRLVREGVVVLIDVREPQDFERSHLPGAISVPLDQLAARADELRATGKPIIVYCCGKGSGVDSERAIATLRSLGVDDVRAIAGGFQRWVDVGFVVEVPPST